MSSLNGREGIARTVSNILGETYNSCKREFATGVNRISSSAGYSSSAEFTEEGGNYTLKTLFYLMLYAFLASKTNLRVAVYQ